MKPSELDETSKWAGSEIGATSKWQRSDFELASKRNRNQSCRGVSIFPFLQGGGQLKTDFRVSAVSSVVVGAFGSCGFPW